MPDLSQIITDNADKFGDIPDAGKVVESIAARVKELGFTPILAGNAKDKPDFVPYSRVEELSGQKNQLTTQNGELAAQAKGGGISISPPSISHFRIGPSAIAAAGFMPARSRAHP